MRALSIEHSRKVWTIIHDKMDHGKTTSPCFTSKNRDTDMFTKLPRSVTGMMAHRHGDERYAHYALHMYHGDCNHIVDSFARPLRDLEESPMSSSHYFFHGTERSPLYRIVLHGSDIYLKGLQAPSTKLIPAIRLPCVLHVRLVNCWKDNKCRFVRTFWFILMMKGIFMEVHVSYLLVGHTMTTSMHHLEDGVWTCVNTITPLSPSS